MGIPKQVLEAGKIADENLARDTGTEVHKDDSEAETSIDSDGNVKIALPKKGADETKPEVVAKPETDVPENKSDKYTDSMLSRVQAEAQKNASILGRINATIEPIREKSIKLEQSVQQYDAKIFALEQKVKELTESRAVKPTVGVPSDATVTQEDVSSVREALGNKVDTWGDDELATLIAVFLVVARKFSVAPQVAGDVQQRLSALENRSSNRMNEDFNRKVASAFPGLEQMDKGKDRRWLAFLNTKVSEFGGEVFGDIVTSSMKTYDFDTFAKCIAEFQRRFNIVFSGSVNSTYSDIRPSQAGGSDPLARSAGGKKPVYLRSQVNAFRKKYNTGALDFSGEEAEKFLKEIDDAEFDNRIVEDVK